MVVGYSWAAAVSLAESDLECQTRDSEEEERNEVRNLFGVMNQYCSSVVSL